MPDLTEQERKDAHVKITKWYCKEYKRMRGFPYHFKKGKDGQALKVALKIHSPKAVCGIIQIMWDTEPPEAWELSFMGMKLNKYAGLYYKSLNDQEEAERKRLETDRSNSTGEPTHISQISGGRK